MKDQFKLVEIEKML